MRSLSKEEVFAWLATGPELTHNEEDDLGFSSGFEEPLHFHPPTGEGQLAFFTRLLTCLHHHEGLFSGALLWVSSWGVWNPWVEQIGYKAFAMLRGEPAGLTRFISTPGQLFDGDESLDAVAFLLWPIVIGWDAYYYPVFENNQLEYFVKLSHDAYIDIHPRDEATRKLIEDRLNQTAFSETKH